MNTKEFRKHIKKHFAPKLHELGFQGTDHHFVKHNNHLIYVLTIQADKHGGSCIMEMGVHLDFLPNSIGEFKSPLQFTAYDCEFRERLNKRSNWLQRLLSVERERGYAYGESEEEAIMAIIEMREIFTHRGISYFSQFNDFPESITTISLDEIKFSSKKLVDLGAPPNLRTALLIARTYEFLSDPRRAKEFASWGLHNIGNASGLSEEFLRIISLSE
ncbi:DUF4304 domain-containing protein [Paenibacillus illinoisensis]|uniref:DUF4304 domain-containing protein n=1 Tax=Paenibacillus illinoisensis TaxID=59845 RepID=UPI001C8D22C5|nr:DUF4304 domain-containing protein [Paenibacillus illinoisensis]MBY0217851.1 DUF4304 domain-containing protein [Paenibacillus illinoisensis]